jgi:hypothetical protein
MSESCETCPHIQQLRDELAELQEQNRWERE